MFLGSQETEVSQPEKKSARAVAGTGFELNSSEFGRSSNFGEYSMTFTWYFCFY